MAKKKMDGTQGEHSSNSIAPQLNTKAPRRYGGGGGGGGDDAFSGRHMTHERVLEPDLSHTYLPEPLRLDTEWAAYHPGVALGALSCARARVRACVCAFCLLL